MPAIHARRGVLALVLLSLLAGYPLAGVLPVVVAVEVVLAGFDVLPVLVDSPRQTVACLGAVVPLAGAEDVDAVHLAHCDGRAYIWSVELLTGFLKLEKIVVEVG